MPGAAFRIHRIEIEGFKAFTAPQPFEIGGGHVFVFGTNGLGKSSLVEAVRWCLFGLPGRQEAEVRNVFYSPGECKVELEMEGPGGRWRIQRRLRPGSNRSDSTIWNPSGATVLLEEVFPGLARLGPREGAHVIFASQQSTRRRPQADITDFDKVLYSYLQINDVQDLLNHLEGEIAEQEELERQLAKKVDDAEESLRSKLDDLCGRIEEILADAPWPGETVPTNAETDARIRAFVKECGGSLESTETREEMLAEADRAIQQLSASTRDAVQRQLTEARANLNELTTARETYKEHAEQLRTAQTRVESCKQDLKNALADKTKQQLLEERDELVRQNNQLAQYLELVRQSEGYFKELSPEECPVCGAGVVPPDVLSRLQGRIESDPRAAELTKALASVRAHLGAVSSAEAVLNAADGTCACVELLVVAARTQLRELLDDPYDLSNSDRMIENLTERIRQLALELRESGSLVETKRNTLKNRRAEDRFQRYRSRKERLLRNLELGLKPAREAHREFIDVLETLRAIREALQKSFNNTLDGTLPRIDALMTEVYGRLTQQVAFPKVLVEPGRSDEKRTVRLRVTSDHTPGKSFDPDEVLNGQARNALNLVPYFVFSQFQAEALDLDCLLIDDPSQSFDTSRVELLMRDLANAADHAQVIVASHEEERFAPLMNQYFPSGSYRVLRVTSFTPDLGPKLEYVD